MQRHLVLLIAGLIFFLGLAPVQGDTSYSYVGHKKYAFKIKAADLKASPTWDMKKHPFPPLSPPEAVEAARKELRELFKDGNLWQMDEITLRPAMDVWGSGPVGWHYLVTFTGVKPEMQDGFQTIPNISIPVLFSGEAIEPTISPWSGSYTEAEPAPEEQGQKFDIFRNGPEAQSIPAGGGILEIAVVDTPSGAKRPSTVQLWLTEKALWQIRTTGETAKFKKLPYPKKATMDGLVAMAPTKFGLPDSAGATTLSAGEIRGLEKTGHTYIESSLNGSLKFSKRGVVYLIPNPYKP